MLHWWFREATDVGSQAWAAEIVRRFEEMRPLAPAALLSAVDVHIGLYTAHATLSGPQLVQALVPFAEQMPEAVTSLDAYCGITPADRGGLEPPAPTNRPDESEAPTTPAPSPPPTPAPPPLSPTPSAAGGSAVRAPWAHQV
jgi:hypothetical protein